MSEDNSNSTVTSYDFILTYPIQFYSFLVVFIPSIICSVFTLYHFLFDRVLRNTLNNHVIIVVLLVGLLCQITNYPWMLHYFHLDGIWERSFVFCSIWAFIDWVFYILQGILFAWATVERHMLIFHDGWVSTKKKRFFVHYLPPFIIILYCLMFYIIIFFLSPCENYWDDTGSLHLCVVFCIYDSFSYYMWDTIIHQFVPCLIIITFSIALFVRVIWQKNRIRQPVQWRKHRKMMIQLFSIVLVYLLFNVPYVCLSFASLCGYLTLISLNATDFLIFLNYFMMLFLPFSCMLTLSKLRKRMANILHLGRLSQAVGPLTTPAR